MRSQDLIGCREVSGVPLIESVPFEISRPIIRHGQPLISEPTTVYDVARLSLDTRWSELGEEHFSGQGMGKVFDFLKYLPHSALRPRIVTTYSHEVEDSVKDDQRLLVNIRDRLASAPLAREGRDPYIGLGSTAFTKVVSTVIHRGPFDEFLFTLQPSEETLLSGRAPQGLRHLVAERQEQVDVLKKYNKGSEAQSDSELNIGIPIGMCSFGDIAHTRAWSELSNDDRDKLNKMLGLASIVLAAEVGLDVNKALHPSNSAGLFSFEAGASQQLGLGAELPAPLQRNGRISPETDDDFEEITLTVSTVPDWKRVLQAHCANAMTPRRRQRVRLGGDLYRDDLMQGDYQNAQERFQELELTLADQLWPYLDSNQSMLE